MGFWETLFGGSELKQIPGAMPFIDAIRGYTGSIKLGMAGKTAKKGLRALAKGEYDSDPTISGYLNPIRDFYATANRDSEREAQMGVGAMFEGAQPVLAARVRSLNEARNREAAGSAMTQMIPGLYEGFSSTFQAAKNAKDSARLGGLQAALQGYLGSFYQQQKTGILPGLASLAQGIGSMATGFGWGKG